MIRRINSLLTRKCQHEHTLVVRSVGVTRTVCENCGHLSFSIQTNITHHFNVDAFLEEDLLDEELPRVSGL